MVDRALKDLEAARRRRTTLLLLGGALSLILPLLIILYIRISGNPVFRRATPPSFAPRKNWTEKVRPAVTPAPVAKPQAAPTGNSLDFVKGGQEYYQEPAHRTPPPEEETEAEPPAPRTTTTKPVKGKTKKATARNTYKAFPQPKLNISNPKYKLSPMGNTPMDGNLNKNQAGQMNPMGQTPPKMPDMNSLLNNIPGAGAPTDQKR